MGALNEKALPSSPAFALNRYDAVRVLQDGGFGLFSLALAWAAQWVAALNGHDFGLWTPVVAVWGKELLDILRRFVRGWDPTHDPHIVVRNALLDILATLIVAWPVLQPMLGTVLPPAVAVAVSWAVGLLLRYVTPANLPLPDHLPDDTLPEPDEIPNIFGGSPRSMPDFQTPLRPDGFPGLHGPLPLLLITVLSMGTIVSAATIRVTGTVSGKPVRVVLIGAGSEYTVDFGEGVSPEPGPAPTPVPPAPPSPDIPTPPKPPEPTPVPPQPLPSPEPNFPGGEYLIAADAYKWALAVKSPARKAECVALADKLDACCKDLDAGKVTQFPFPDARTVSNRLKADIASVLTTNAPAWDAEFGKPLKERLTAAYNASRLNTQKQWATLLREIVPALREAAKR